MVIKLDKILTFIVNDENKILLLKGNNNDPQFNKSFWYVVTGGCEKYDKTREDTVIREISEETGITKVNDIIYLNWIFKYESLGVQCTEYVYISFVEDENVILNEESIEYKWCELEEFISQIHWFSDKAELSNVLERALNKKLYFKNEKINNV